jgi:hypothetical protein
MLTGLEHRCEHYNKAKNKDHLLVYTIGDGSYDVDYIDAHFSNDTEELHRIESVALAAGAGPQRVCTTVSNFSSQKVFCHAYLGCFNLRTEN